MRSKKDVTIIGAGMAGCLMAIYLAKEGYNVTLYESRSDQTAALSNRSINQSLSAKGIRALQKIGLWEEVKKLTVPQRGRLIHQISGELLYQSYGHNQDLIEWTINRNQLNNFLLTELKKYKNVHVFFNEKLTYFNLKQKELHFENIVTGEKTVKNAAMIIGADGIHSVVRKTMEKEKITKTEIDKRTWGYKNIYIPEDQGKGLAFDKHAFHLWSRKNTAIFGMVNKGFFTCTLVLPLSGENSFESLSCKESVLLYFKKNFPDLSPYMEEHADEFVANQPTTFTTLYTSQWSYKDSVVLIGDAAHAMTIFLGQGINSAFDDCLHLAECLKQFPPQKAFVQFQNLRKANTDTIAEICILRFTELKDKFEDQHFLAKKMVEERLEALFPKRWWSLYNLLVHTDLPYAKALQKYNRQLLIARLLGYDVVAGILWAIMQAKTKRKKLTLRSLLRQKRLKPQITPAISE
jgi:kynurenine 3-monooxygenase